MGELEKVQAQTVARMDQPQDLMAAVLRAAMDNTIDVAKMTALADLKIKMDLHELELRKYNAQVEFASAKAALQAVAPRVAKNGKIVNHKTDMLQSRYALLEDIDLILRPLFEEYGFSMSITNAATSGSLMRFVAKVTHRLGHWEEVAIDLPRDGSGSKNETQGAVSTSSYAHRALMKLWARVIEEGTDKNGEQPDLPISEQQVMTLRDMLNESGTAPAKLLKWAKVETLEQIPVSKYKAAMAGLKTAIDQRGGK